ncbi:hypothetical protein U1Q18_031599, partial [Sarracenia purpurea var. burkii]
GVLLGLSTTVGVLAGVFGTASTGYILQHGGIAWFIHYCWSAGWCFWNRVDWLHPATWYVSTPDFVYCAN